MTHFLFTPGAEIRTAPFEDWCEAEGVHPEAFGAWEEFVLRSAAAEVNAPQARTA